MAFGHGRPVGQVGSFYLPSSSLVDADVFSRFPYFTRFNEVSRSVALATLLGSAAVLLQPAVPFNRTDWQNPRQQQRLIADQNGFIGSSSAGLLNVVTAPFAQTDWPIPKGRQPLVVDQLGGIQQSRIWLVGLDQFFGAPGQVPTFDWTNPIRSKAADLRSFSNNTTYLIGQDVFFGAAGQVQSFDWPVPRAALPAISLKTASLSSTYLIGQDIFFGAPGQVQSFDWPNPGKSKAADLRSFTYNTTYLIGQDIFYGAPGQVQSFDWTNPVRSKLSIQGHIDSYKIALNIVFAPFAQIDWPNPVRSKSSPSGYIDPSSVWLIGQDSFFGAPGQVQSFDWPNPVRRVASIYSWTDSYKIALNFISFSPFFQLDWPNPIRAAIPTISLKTFSAGTTYLIGQDSFFGAPGQVQSFNWPNPVQLKPAALTFIDPYKIALNVVFAPFAQFDWPVPRAAQPSIGLKTVSLSSTYLIGQDVFYGAAGQVPRFDWPNPVRRIASIYSWTDPYKVALNFAPSPFFQLDWPNPQRRVSSQVYSWTDSYKVILFGVPFAQRDWPNPRRPVSSPVYGWIDTYKISIFSSFAPFFKTDWPNPSLGAIPATNLKFFSFGSISWIILNLFEPERVATTVAENRIATVSAENRSPNTIVEARSATTVSETRAALTLIDNRSPIAPEDKE